MPDWKLQAVTDADPAFLLHLFTATEGAALAPLLPVEALTMMMQMQLNAQRQHLAATRPQAQDMLVVETPDAAEAKPVGRLWLDRSGDLWRVLDIRLLPSHQGQGLGARVLAEVQAQARTVGAGVDLHVALHNPAQRLYARLGFVPAGVQGVSLRMVWPAPAG